VKAGEEMNSSCGTTHSFHTTLEGEKRKRTDENSRNTTTNSPTNITFLTTEGRGRGGKREMMILDISPKRDGTKEKKRRRKRMLETHLVTSCSRSSCLTNNCPLHSPCMTTEMTTTTRRRKKKTAMPTTSPTLITIPISRIEHCPNSLNKGSTEMKRTKEMTVGTFPNKRRKIEKRRGILMKEWVVVKLKPLEQRNSL
jgi:hypothetical protein